MTSSQRSDKPKGFQKSGLQELQDPTGDRGSVKFQGIHGSAGSPEPDLSNAAFSTLSNVPESTESGRFEIRGFAGSSDPFSFQNERPRFFLLPEEAERVQGPPELIKIRLGPPTSSGSIGDPLSFLAQ